MAKRKPDLPAAAPAASPAAPPGILGSVNPPLAHRRRIHAFVGLSGDSGGGIPGEAVVTDGGDALVTDGGDVLVTG